MRSRLTDEAARLALFALVFAVYVTGSVGVVGANAGSHYALIRALVDEGRCSVDTFVAYTQGIDVAFKDGHAYSNKPPGTAVLALPLYLAGKAWGHFFHEPAFRVGHDRGRPAPVFVLFLPALAGAASAAMVHRLSRRLGAGPWAAGLAALVLAFGTLSWRYGTALYAHVLAGAFATAACLLAVRTGDLRREPRDGFLLGLGLGAAAVTDYVHVLLLPVVVLYLLVARKLRRPGSAGDRLRLLACPAGLALPALLLAAYGTTCFGSPLSVGYGHATSWNGGADVARLSMSDPLPGFSTPLARGLADLLLGGGEVRWPLLWTSPVLLAWIPGAILLARRTPAEALLVTAAPLVIASVMAKFRAYWGGSPADTRYLVAALPLLTVPIATAASALAAPLRRRNPLALFAAFLLVCAGGVSFLHAAAATSGFDGHPIGELFWPPTSLEDVRLSLAALFPSPWHAPLAAGWIGLCWVAVALWRTRGLGRAPLEPPLRVVAMVAAVSLALWLVAAAGPERGRPYAITRYEVSDDGAHWRELRLPLFVTAGVRRVRAVLDVPDQIGDVALAVQGEACVASAYVNGVVRLRDERCMTRLHRGPTRFSATGYLVPGPNRIELELLSPRPPAQFRGFRVVRSPVVRRRQGPESPS